MHTISGEGVHAAARPDLKFIDFDSNEGFLKGLGTLFALRYTSIFDCVRQMLRNEGVAARTAIIIMSSSFLLLGLKSFWKGRGASFLINLLSSGITFAVYEETR